MASIVIYNESIERIKKKQKKNPQKKWVIKTINLIPTPQQPLSPFFPQRKEEEKWNIFVEKLCINKVTMCV